jgi:hypothetical protein
MSAIELCRVLKTLLIMSATFSARMSKAALASAFAIFECRRSIAGLAVRYRGSKLLAVHTLRKRYE